jgi:hypothetical protein
MDLFAFLSLVFSSGLISPQNTQPARLSWLPKETRVPSESCLTAQPRAFTISVSLLFLSCLPENMLR